MKRPDVYRYLDYRAYLKDWLAHQRASRSGLTLRGLAEASKLAPGYLSMVISGRRPLTENALARIIGHLGLTASERSYFENLVKLDTAESQQVRLNALKKMKRHRAYRKHNPKELEVHQYLTRWHYVAIRELSMVPGFRADPEWIQPRLRSRVELREIREALSFLRDHGYIEVLPDGSARPPEKRLECDGGIFRLSLGGFHSQMLSLAAESIDGTPREERNLLGHAFAADPKIFDQANAILREAYEKIRSLGERPASADSVYFVELALFPLTRKSKPAKEQS